MIAQRPAYSPEKYAGQYVAAFCGERHDCPLEVTITATWQSGRLQTIRTKTERCGAMDCRAMTKDPRSVPALVESEFAHEVRRRIDHEFFGSIAVRVSFCDLGATQPVVVVEETMKVG